jgi:DNA-binding Lrp family transcriptional regulator
MEQKVVYFLINVEHGKLKIVSNDLRKIEEIVEVVEVFGRYDIIAKALVNDDYHLKSFYQNKITLLSGITRTETVIGLPEDEGEDAENTEGEHTEHPEEENTEHSEEDVAFEI